MMEQGIFALEISIKKRYESEEWDAACISAYTDTYYPYLRNILCQIVSVKFRVLRMSHAIVECAVSIWPLRFYVLYLGAFH